MKRFVEYLRENYPQAQAYVNSAYWIDSKGKIVAVNARHIESVIKHPAFFGETPQKIKETYEKHNEPLSSTVEGNARNEIMLRVLQRGYIRIRETKHKWSVETWKLTPKLEEGIWVWAKHLAGLVNHKFDDVFIHELQTRKMKRTSINKVASGATIKESVEWLFINENDLTDLIE